ncbi:MAG: DEAD/DEAH box helicase [Candidatus Kapabacteria bacterium]|nr:DEAD/DEAH box helicase [Candidatus Kapabacteria bacterium]
MTFQELGIAPELIKAISELGFANPMPVQEQVIPLLLKSDTNVVALAQTGTGKTAAFGLPILQKIDLSLNHVQVLILSPTRELCIQIADDLMDYAKYIEKLRIVPVYGGASIDTQFRALKKGAHIIVATPGRLIDMIERRAVKLDHVSKLILDEADEMLNMGFTDSIESILSHIPDESNKLMFSATMPPEIARIAKKYMKNPIEITVGSKNAGADNIKHICYTVHAKDKYSTLKRIADFYPNIYGIVFCRTRIETQEIADKLIADGYNAEPLHGDLSQGQRDTVMGKFRHKTIQLLVATDVAARGIDVNDLTHIINYNLPEDSDAYNHRSGRTGRAGKTGISIAIINMKEKYRIRLIEKKIGKEFVWDKVPNGKEVCEKQLFHLIEKIEHIEIEHHDIEPYLPIIYKKLGWIEKEDLIKRLVSVEFNRFLQYYRDAEDLNLNEAFPSRDKGGKRDSRFDRDSRENEREDFTKLFINVGRSDGFYPSMLIEMLNKSNKGTKFKIGKIDIQKNHSVFEIDSNNYPKVIKSINGLEFEDRQLVVKVDKEPAGGGGGRDRDRGGSSRDNDKRKPRRKK